MNSMILPKRAKPNSNEALILKQESGPRNITLDGCLQYVFPPNEVEGNNKNGRVEFMKSAMRNYFLSMQRLAKRMLPVYAVALGLPKTYFDPAFKIPTIRFRQSRYPSRKEQADEELSQYGIAPHVDTTFFTLLVSDSPGLALQVGAQDNGDKSTKTVKGATRTRAEWLQVPILKGSVLVNTGQILRQLTNDRWAAARHYAVNPDPNKRYVVWAQLDVTSTNKQLARHMLRKPKIPSEIEFPIRVFFFCVHSRISLPFFFNATATYPMAVVPTCQSESEPPKYPTVSYLDGQALLQGE